MAGTAGSEAVCCTACREEELGADFGEAVRSDVDVDSRIYTTGGGGGGGGVEEDRGREVGKS